jgi:hypothetical protein
MFVDEEGIRKMAPIKFRRRANAAPLLLASLGISVAAHGLYGLLNPPVQRCYGGTGISQAIFSCFSLVWAEQNEASKIADFSALARLFSVPPHRHFGFSPFRFLAEDFTRHSSVSGITQSARSAFHHFPFPLTRFLFRGNRYFRLYRCPGLLVALFSGPVEP